MKKYLLLSILFLVACRSGDTTRMINLGGDKTIKLIRFPHEANLDLKTHPEHFSEKDYSAGIQDFAGLGMANVPVLDQGAYGTCVTFSSTAALDALLAKGNFISQECSLALNKALGNNYWDGAYFPSQIVDPLKRYGVISQSKCPRAYADESYLLSSLKYARYISKPESAVVKGVSYKYYDDPSIEQLREIIDRGHRVMIGFVLDGSDRVSVRGFDAQVDGKVYQGGLWACEQSGKKVCEKYNAGHEVVVMGYDDAQELVKIRNSWSSGVGKDGDYYMSYKYFESQVLDMTEIW